jgi:predicted metal-dependent phosphoesterase TrpH
VAESCRGYEITRNEGERLGLDVFFGWEESFGGDDYLVYGLGKEWLFEHPEAADWTRKEQFKEVKFNGGCVVNAHPFRYMHSTGPIFGNKISEGRTAEGYMDAVEAGNSANAQFSDALAMAYAKKLKLPATAGSDIHYSKDIRQETVFGVFMEKRMKTIADYVDAVLNNTIAGLKVPAGHFDL